MLLQLLLLCAELSFFLCSSCEPGTENHSLCSFRLAKQGVVKCMITQNCWLIAGGSAFVSSEQVCVKFSTSLAGQSARDVAKYTALFLFQTCDLHV